MERGTRFHHATQNSLRFKTYELFISGNFHLTFSDCGWLQVTETTESETLDKGGLPNSRFVLLGWGEGRMPWRCPRFWRLCVVSLLTLYPPISFYSTYCTIAADVLWPLTKRWRCILHCDLTCQDTSNPKASRLCALWTPVSWSEPELSNSAFLHPFTQSSIHPLNIYKLPALRKMYGKQ